jgi:hypothetical protein
MRTSAIALALLVALLATPAGAQTAAGGVVNSSPNQRVVYVESGGFAEAAVSSCAGGAMIGFLAALAVGTPSPGSTAALFCGLSVAATTASSITSWTWYKVTSIFY